MAAIKSKLFKQGKAEDFNKILKRQKKDESDPKFAISDSLQEYQQQLEASAGYQNQMKLNKANIRQDIVNFVIDYTVGDLDQLKGMDFDDAKTQQKTTEKTIKEYEGLHKKGIINDEEIVYIKETVGKTNAQLRKVLGLSTKLSLSFRDFKKELKPLKLAKRFGMTRIPILGKKIERAIESEERAESKALGMKRQLRRKEQKADFKSGGAGGFAQGDLGAPKPAPNESGGRKDLAAKGATAAVMGMTGGSGGGDGEDRVEEERESDAQFDTSSGLLERILEESELTNQLLGKQGKKSGGLLSKILTSLGIGGAIALATTAMGKSIIDKFGKFGNTIRRALGLPVNDGDGKKKNKTKGKTNRAMVNQANEPKKQKTKVVSKSNRSNLAKSNVRTTGSVPSVTGSNTKAINAKANKSGLQTAARYGKNVVRAGGRLLWPAAVLMGAYDGVKGWANAAETLGKDEDDLTTGDKVASGVSGFIEGLTFGLVSEERFALGKKLAGEQDWFKKEPHKFQSDTAKPGSANPRAKLSKVNELKIDNIDKVTLATGINHPAHRTSNNITHVDNSTTKNETATVTVGTTDNNPNNKVIQEIH